MAKIKRRCYYCNRKIKRVITVNSDMRFCSNSCKLSLHQDLGQKIQKKKTELNNLIKLKLKYTLKRNKGNKIRAWQK